MKFITVYTIYGKGLRVSKLEYENPKIDLLGCYNNKGKLVFGNSRKSTCAIRRRELCQPNPKVNQ